MHRYQFMADDRTSFMKSQSQLTGTTELDALAATARGDKAGYYKARTNLDDDNESISSESMRRRADSRLSIPVGVPPPQNHHYQNQPRSPVDPSVPYSLPTVVQIDQLSPYGPSSASAFRAQNNSTPTSFRTQNNARFVLCLLFLLRPIITNMTIVHGNEARVMIIRWRPTPLELEGSFS